MYEIVCCMLEEYFERVIDYERLKERAASNSGFSYAYWCGGEECEDKVKSETRATIRCIPFDQPESPGPCIVCGAESDTEVVFARAY